MKLLLLILMLIPSGEWKHIRELSGDIPDHPGLTLEVYVSEIARGDDLVKLSMRADFPGGAPIDVFKANVPHGFDASSITRIQTRLELNCRTLVVKPVKGSAEIYQFNGKKHKSKEPPFTIQDGHLLASYFCERGDAPKVAPTLKP